jgi:hypothetical protein
VSVLRQRGKCQSIPLDSEDLLRKDAEMKRTQRLIFITSLIIVLANSPLLAKQPRKQGRDQGRTHRLVYFDGHMHTTHSDGSGSIADLKEAALARGLSAVLITNHTKQIVDLAEWNEIVAESEALSEKDFLMIPSFEVTGSEGMLNRDHFLAWGVYDPFVGDDADALAPEEVWESPRNYDGTGPLFPEVLRQWVDYIHENDGLAVHVHTSGTTQPDYGANFIELYNLSYVKDVANSALALGFTIEQAWGLGTVVNNFAIYGNRDLYELYPFPGTPYPIPLRLALYLATGEWLDSPEADPMHSWDDLLMDYVSGQIDAPVFGLANSDAHNTANLPIGGEGYDDSDVGEVKNGVYLKKLNRGQFFKALRNGNLFATTGPSLYFDVNGQMMGETVTIKPEDSPIVTLNFSAKSENPNAVLVKLDVIKNAEAIRTSSPGTAQTELILDDEVTKDSYYRVEVTSYDMATGMYYFAWANPVFVNIKQ